MAYLTLVAAVSQDQIDAIQTDERAVLTPTLLKGVSHLLGYWIELQPLGELLARTIDGGHLLNFGFWYPLRPPMVHQSTDIPTLTDKLEREWGAVHGSPDFQDDWLESEMNRLIAVMTHACDNESAVVTALDLPADEERAQRVRIPWQPYSPVHGAPRRWWWMLWRR